MKNFKDTIRTLTALLLLAAAAITAGCSDDDTKQPVVTEGVVFEFSMRTIYGLESMTDIASVKITLAQNNKSFDLPSFRLSGNDQLVSTQPYRLAPGSYTFLSYIAYDAASNLLFKVEVDDNNNIEVKANELTVYELPINVRVVEFPDDYYRNAIRGLCIEVFGENNEEAWPWDFTKKDLRDMQKRHRETPYLEFEEDDYDNIMYLDAINLTGEDFAAMTELPALTLANLKSAMGLTLTDLPNLKTIKDLGSLDHLQSLTIVNTGLEEISAEIGKCIQLHSLSIVDGKIKSLPAAVASLEKLDVLNLRGNQIERFDTSLTGLKELKDVNLSNNPLTTIGNEIFSAEQPLRHLDFSDTQISTLPAAIGQISGMRDINLTNCRFTSVPAAITGNANLCTVWLSGNPMTVAPADFAGMTKLEGLFLSGISFTTAPALNIPSLVLLAMNDCSLTTAPNVAGLPNLRQLELNGNNIASGSFDFSVNNLRLRVLLVNNSAAAMLPEVKVKMENGKPADFALLDVSDCPNLRLTTPAAWNCFDLHLGDITGQDNSGKDIYESIFESTNGRVAVCRTNSSGVTFGK